MGPSEPGSVAFFLAERYLLVTAKRDGQLLWGQVHHTPYELRHAKLHKFEDTLSAAVGLPEAPVAHVCYCEGVRTRVWPLSRDPR